MGALAGELKNVMMSLGFRTGQDMAGAGVAPRPQAEGRLPASGRFGRSLGVWRSLESWGGAPPFWGAEQFRN
jgi:hypothetical protein